MRNRKRRIWPGILLILSLVWLGAAGCGNFGDRQADSGQGNTELNGETLEVHFIDVGQGDATLIKQGDHAMLIDAGDNDKGTALQSYLQHQGVEHLDYAVGTHPDSDHIGGLDVVLYKFSWDQVIMPDLEKDTKTYQDVLRVIQDKGTEITYPKAGAVYSLGSAEFTVIAPVKEDYGDNWNDYSVGISLQFGKNRFVFTGDAEEDAEQDMLAQGIDLSADVLKAAHHGSDTANTMEFLEEVNPRAVVISCGEGNSYGHPRAGAMNNFRSIGAEVYRTDEQGTIVAVSDGETITWNCSSSESWKAGEPKGSSVREEEPEEAAELQPGESDLEQGPETYVINTNTGKFHKDTCSSVEQMQEENKEYSSLSVQDLKARGYEPCGRCFAQ